MVQSPQEIPSLTGRSSISGGARESGAPSLGSNQDISAYPEYSPKGTSCPDAYAFREKCGHTNWKWRRVPCRRWSCAVCARARLHSELVPELFNAIDWGQELDATAKFLLLTWQADLPAAQPTKEGGQLRARQVSSLVRWIRSQYGFCHYLRVSETHQSGKFHVHLVVLMPWVTQRELSERWKFFSGSSYVHIEYLYTPCPTPNCYAQDRRGRPVRDKRGRPVRSKLIPPSSRTSGVCATCGYAPDWSKPEVFAQVALDAARYVGKYITKQGGQGDHTRLMNRSQEWNKVCRPKVEKPGRAPCTDCGKPHEFHPLIQRPDVGGDQPHYPKLETERGLLPITAYHPIGGAPCSCWDAYIWRACVPQVPEVALMDTSQSLPELLQRPESQAKREKWFRDATAPEWMAGIGATLQQRHELRREKRAIRRERRPYARVVRRG
jgi:hypothetical protein